MTRIEKYPNRRGTKPTRSPGHWLLQNAKARFSDMVWRVRRRSTTCHVHGRKEFALILVEEFCRLKGDRSGEALIAAMQASPFPDINIEPVRTVMPVHDVAL